MSKSKDNRYLGIVNQITRPVAVLELVIILLNFGSIFGFNVITSMMDLQNTTYHISDESVEILESYDNIDYLVSFWHDNYDRMELFYDDATLYSKEVEFDNLYSEVADTELITSEQSRALNYEEQLLLSEICYCKLSHDFDRIKRSYDPKYLYGFVVDDNGQMLFVLTGANEEESRISSGGELYELGCTSENSPDDEQLSGKLVTTGFASNVRELTYFAPVTVDGKIIMYVGVTTDWSDLLQTALSLSVGLTALITILLALLVLIFYKILKKVAVNPLIAERDIVNAYGDDKDSKKAVEYLNNIDSKNEIEELADAFASLLSELDLYMDEVRTATADKERLGAELDMAASIQSSQLPSTFPAFPGRNEFSIFASMTPAKTVGGDFYDFFLIDDDHIALVMADVSGKGVPASLFMMISKLLIKNSLQNGKSPAEALTDTNKQLTENNEAKQFVTVWLAVIEISTGKGIAANAGHEHPVLRRAGKDYELVEYKHSVPVATLKKAKFSEHEFELHPGDSLFVYTDGVPEATNAGDELFGNDRMLVALNKNPAADPRLILKTVKDSVDEFVGEAEQFDDLTMLCFRYNGSESGAKDE